MGKFFTDACPGGPNRGACSGDNGYAARIKNCFGNTLTYAPDSDIPGDPNVWDVSPTATAASSDVNPVSDDYQNANCGDTGDQQWNEIIMFVFDANNIKALDCLDGSTDTSSQSCDDEGFGATAASSSTTTAAGFNNQAGQQLVSTLISNSGQ